MSKIKNTLSVRATQIRFLFFRPLDITIQYLETNYLQRFLISPMFKNYIKELIGTITVSLTGL